MKTELGPNFWSVSLAASFCGSSKDLGWGTMAKPFDKQLAQLGTKQSECLRLSRQKYIYIGLSLFSESFGEILLDLYWVHVCIGFHNLSY